MDPWMIRPGPSCVQTRNSLFHAKRLRERQDRRSRRVFECGHRRTTRHDSDIGDADFPALAGSAAPRSQFSTDSASPSFDCLGRRAMSDHLPHHLRRAVERTDFSREMDRRRCCWTSRSTNCVKSSNFFAPTRLNRRPCRGSPGKKCFTCPSSCRSLTRESPNLLLTFFTVNRASQKLTWAPPDSAAAIDLALPTEMSYRICYPKLAFRTPRQDLAQAHSPRPPADRQYGSSPTCPACPKSRSEPTDTSRRA
jgi:hypothetical protein